MLKRAPAYTIIPASDLERARMWWEEKAGLTPDREDMGGFWYECGDGTWFYLYRTDSAGTARNTQMSFRVPDLRAEMAELRERGVVFEDYDFGEMKTVDGMLEIGPHKTSWFRDSEGNTIEVTELGAET